MSGFIPNPVFEQIENARDSITVCESDLPVFDFKAYTDAIAGKRAH